MDAYTHQWYDPPEPGPDQEPEPEAAELLSIVDGVIWWTQVAVAA
jgi:hypothetical protein